MTAAVALVVNPVAGRGRAARVVAPIIERLAEIGTEVRVLSGTDPEGSQDLCVRSVADGVSALIAAGGDGMVHPAVQAVAGSFTPLGIIPMGTGECVPGALQVLAPARRS